MISNICRKQDWLLRIASTQKRTIMYSNGQPYDKRWQNQFNHAYFVELDENELTGKPKPEDSRETARFMTSVLSAFDRRYKTLFSMFWARRNRVQSPFELYFLPGTALFLLQFWPLDWSFKILSLIPVLSLYTRVRDKCMDPECPETFLRDMLDNNEVVKKHFSVETMQTMDYQFDFTKGFPDEVEFPEFKNKYFSFLKRIFQ